MKNIYKKDYFVTIGLVIIVLLLIGSWFWSGLETLVTPPEYASAAISSTVTVSAEVTAVISCSTDQDSTAFGTLTSSAVSTSVPNASSIMSCVNSGGGCTLYVKDTGGGGNPGLWNSASSALIPSPDAAYSATATLVAGTAGYGIQAATTAAGSGATLTIATRYLQTGDTVGGLVLTNTTLASNNATSSNREVVTTYKAAISTSTPAGTYSDTATFECTAN